jgi:hypothetical protein
MVVVGVPTAGGHEAAQQAGSKQMFAKAFNAH